MSEPKPDGTATLLGVLYPGVDESKLVRNYLGGSEAPMLYEAAEKITSLEAERDKLREVMIKAAGKLVINRPEDEEGWLRADRVMREAAIQLRDASALNTGETITDSTD